MSKNLLIVESPAKAKTIEKILGKDFTVKSSYGHIRDLDKGNGSVDVNNNFQPTYVVTPDKQRVVKELKDWVKKVDHVWLATDEDREGEAISWHLCHVLGLDERETKRIVFREITAPAIKSAIQSPRTVDLNLVDAQQARRILDRLVGFELSELLWKKVKGKLSAGRVQSVAVKLIVDREREIQQFNTTSFYKVSALFDVKSQQGRTVKLKAELPTKFKTEEEAANFLNKSNGASFSIKDIQIRPTKRRPTAPFTTSTLQQEASRKLGFSVKRTMINAQKLYEAGHITYMRTDSVNLSETALQSIAEEVASKYGENYVETRRFKTKKADAQEAHEAIRPTRIQNTLVTTDRDQQRLYELIWKRTIASQMADAQLEKTTVKIGISTLSELLHATGEVVKFDGFLKVYLESKDDDDEEGEAAGVLPPLKVGQVLDLSQMTATERFTRSAARFTEAGLVKKMEELGIGRPSTYAPTISKIMETGRGYVVKDTREGTERKYTIYTLKSDAVNKSTATEMTGASKNRLFPTDMGMLVSDFLSEHFDRIMDYGFTASIEAKFDEVAGGKEQWTEMLRSFYQPFHADVEETLEKAERASGERILGIDPVSGRTLLVRMARTGRPVVQIGKPEELDEDEKPKYGNLRKGQSLETITFEEALDLFQLPKTLGTYLNEEAIVAIGRFGPYVKHGEKFISLGRNEDPMTVSLERAKELIDEKIKADSPVATYKALPVTKGKGRFGPFLKWNDWFVNIPRRYDPETISQDEIYELLAAKEEKEANRYVHQWEDEGISVENGRWGPFIRFKKKKINIPKKDDGKRVTSDEAALMTKEEFKELIVAEVPDAFTKKTRAKRKPAAKKTTKKTTKK